MMVNQQHHQFNVLWDFLGAELMNNRWNVLLQSNTTTDPGNSNGTMAISTVMDHFPPWLNVITLLIIIVCFVICCIQTFTVNQKRKIRSPLGRNTLKFYLRIFFCCCYDSQSQVWAWNIPLQFSIQYLIAFTIKTIHSMFLQYFFESTYVYTCFHYLDTITNKMRRTCPLINLVDIFASVLVKATFILLLLFWLELAFNTTNYYNPKSCKRFERIARRTYWALLGLYLVMTSVGFIGFTVTRTNISYFLVAITLIFDISIPIMFLVFGIVLRRIVSKSQISFPVIVKKHLNRVTIISIILGLYLSLSPSIRVVVLVLKNLVYASNGYNAVSSIVEVVTSILFFFIPSVVTFAIVVAPTSISFLYNKVTDRNAKAKKFKQKWRTNSVLKRESVAMGDGEVTELPSIYYDAGYKNISLEENPKSLIGGHY